MTLTAQRQKLTAAQLRSLSLDLRRELTRQEQLPAARQDRVEMDELQAALQRMDDGSYGWCVGCDRPIPFDRLQVMPMTRRCVQCALIRG